MRHLARLLLAVALIASAAALAQQPAPARDVHHVAMARWAVLQAADGRWSSRDLGRVGLEATVAVPGRKGDDLAVTAAMTWMFIGEGNTTKKGPYRNEVRRADVFLQRALKDARESSSDELVPGESLAFAVLADLDLLASDAGRRRILSRELERLARLRESDGTYWEGPSTPIAESTGWVVVGRRLAAKRSRRRNEDHVDDLVRTWLVESAPHDPTAAAFALYVDSIAKGRQQNTLPARLSDLATRLRIADATADPPGPVPHYVQLVTARRLRGRVFETRSILVLDVLEKSRFQEGPWQGGWPPSGDPRGSLWDAAWSTMARGVAGEGGVTGLVR